MPLEEARRLLAAAKRPLLVTHWDMDGVASAVAASWYTSGVPVGVYVPPFTYSLRSGGVDVAGEIARKAASTDADVVVLTDLAYPEGDLAAIKEALGGRPLLVIDHHAQPSPPRVPGVAYFNPVVEGMGRPEDWPSAAHVVVHLSGVEPREPLLIAASIVGDLSDRAVAHPVYRMYMQMAGMDPDSDYRFVVENCVSRIDGAVTMGVREALVNVIEMAAIHGESACEVIIRDAFLAGLAVQAEEELRELLDRAEPSEVRAGGRVLVYRLEGEGKHASRLARSLAARHEGRVVVVAYTSRRMGRSWVYARLRGSAAPRLVELAPCIRRLGVTAGGKSQADNNVVASEVEPGMVEEVLRVVVRGVEALLEGRKPC